MNIDAVIAANRFGQDGMAGMRKRGNDSQQIRTMMQD